jgi:hypothetical protein
MSTQDDSSQDLGKLTANTNETAVEDDDVEAHKLAANTNETVKSDDD